MNYQKMMHRPSQFYGHHQVFYENPEYIDEAESFLDNLSFSESDGFIGAPFVHSIPSHDIQELYVRNPSMVTSSQMLHSPQQSRQYMNGQTTIREFTDLKPRVPLHLKLRGRINTTGNQSQYVHQSTSGIRRNISGRNQQRPCTAIRNITGVPTMSNHVIAAGSRGAFPNELTRGYTVNPYRARPTARPSNPMPNKNMLTISEPVTNYQNKDLSAFPNWNQYPVTGNRPRDTKLGLKKHTRQSFEEKNNIIDVECDREVNSEGDATGCVEVDDLDAIGRIAASLDVEEAEKLSDRQKMEIKEMSKCLKPRVPSSVRSLQERTSFKKSNSTIVNDQITDGNQKKAEKVHVTFRKSLDSILNQLENCESSLNAVRARFSITKNDSKAPGNEASRTNVIFNLKDISDKLEHKADDEGCVAEDENVEVPEVRSDNTIEEVSSGFGSRVASRGTMLDDTTALELHRSKSYIVDLIDRALSKELGTVPNGTREKFDGFNPMKAVRNIEMNKRNETFGMEDPSSFREKGEEPLYIRELKKLRWGHFKHIQKEVQRLEELEKFLDNCDPIET